MRVVPSELVDSFLGTATDSDGLQKHLPTETPHKCYM